MEIQGYIPLSTKFLSSLPKEVKIDMNRMSIEGGQTSTINEFNVILTFRCIINSRVPKVEASDPELNYDKYGLVSRGIKITTNPNLDIVTNEEFTAVSYADGSLVTMPENCLAGSTIVNILENTASTDDVKSILDKALDELNKVNLPNLDWTNMFLRNGKPYADVYLDSNFSVITDGVKQIETTTDAITGQQNKKAVWRGNYPLDRMIYTIQSNLDILFENNAINKDMYGNLYATLFGQALQTSAVLEQARLELYENASQFQIKSQIEYYLQAITAKISILKALADFEISVLEKALTKIKSKVFYVQMNGYKANNIQKTFATQLDGISTSYAAGILDTTPSIYNNAELMSLYTQVKTDMNLT